MAGEVMVNIIKNRTVRKIILIVLSALIALICLFLVFYEKNNSNEFQDPEVLEKISKVLHGQNEISEASLIAARSVSHLAKNNSENKAKKLSSAELNAELTKVSEVLEKPLNTRQVNIEDVINPLMRADLESLASLDPSGDDPSLRFDSSNNILSISGDFKLTSQDQTVSSVADEALSLVMSHKALTGFGINESAALNGSPETNARDEVIVRIDRVYDGLPVWGRQLVVTAKNGSVRSITGKFKPISDNLDTSARIDASKLQDIVSIELDSVVSTISIESYERGIYIFTNMPIYAYKVKAEQADGHRWDLYFDANTKALITKIPLFYESVTPSSGIDLQATNRSFNSNAVNGGYNLLDITFPESGGTHIGIENGDSLSYIFSNRRNSGWDPAAVSAMYNAQQSFDYFFDAHSRNSFDGQGARLVAIVNVTDEGEPYENATWGNGIMRYGTGGGAQGWNNVAISKDVSAHEFAHGVVEHSANLVYQNQSGALNESFADFFGAMVDREDWYIGEDLYSSGGYMRSMSNPESKGHPAHMRSFWNLPNTKEGDYGGVHINSGIPNKALYLIAEGLTAEGLGQSIGKEKTEILAYATLLKLSPNSEFIDSANTMILEAENIFGRNSPEYTAVTSAWDAVGVTTSDVISDGGVSQFSLETGDDLLVHLYPKDGSMDDLFGDEYDIYVQVVNKPFTSWVPSAEIGPINDVPALGVSPAVFTSPNGSSYVIYKGNDSKFRIASIDNSGEDQTLMEDSSINSLTFSPGGEKFALVFANSSDIHIYNFVSELWESIAVTGPSYSTSGEGEAAEAVDAISFDTSGQKLIFDFSICRETPDQEECLKFWSVGIYDYGTKTTQYPFSTTDANFDIGYPKFSNTRNNVISFDLINWTDYEAGGQAVSNVIIYDLESREILGNYDTNGGETLTYAWGISSFIGEDDALAMQVMFDDATVMAHFGLDSNYQYTQGSLSWLTPFDSGFGRAHRNAYKNITASLQSDKSSWGFGSRFAGFNGSKQFSVTNNGNREISITSITSSSYSLSTDLTNRTIQPSESVYFNVGLNTDQVGLGIFSGNLTLQHTGDNAALNLGISAYIDIDTDNDGTLNSTDNDDDNDGIADTLDAFPLDPSESIDTDSDGVGNNADTDDDNDGVADTLEISNGTNPLLADSDGDGVLDGVDAFPLDATETVDTDGDGIGDNSDTDANGDGISDDDIDGDGFINSADIFPSDGNEWFDSDGDGVGDNTDSLYNPAEIFNGYLVNRMHACSTGTDTVLSFEINGQRLESLQPNEALNIALPAGRHVITIYKNEIFRLTYIKQITASNFSFGFGCNWDGLSFENITADYNIRFENDADFDGIFGYLDTDDDNDGVADTLDAFPLDASEALDSDIDGIGNNADIDDDNDGIADNLDLFPLDASETLDHDGDGVGNNADTDDDNDGIADSLDVFPLDASEALDSDGDGVGNNADSDDDNDGIMDSLDRFSLTPYDQSQKLLDIDGNGQLSALTDGLIILRYAFGFTGDDLIDGAIADGATRTSSEEIEAYLDTLIPDL